MTYGKTQKIYSRFQVRGFFHVDINEKKDRVFESYMLPSCCYLKGLQLVTIKIKVLGNSKLNPALPLLYLMRRAMLNILH